MKKGLINEAARLQELAGIQPIKERRSDSVTTVNFHVTDVTLDGIKYAEIFGQLEVSGDYQDDEYMDGYLFQAGGWGVTDYKIENIEGAMIDGEEDYIEDEQVLDSLIPKLEASKEAEKQLNAAADEAEFDSDFGQDPDAWHDRDR